MHEDTDDQQQQTATSQQQVGDYLRQKREEAGLTEADICAKTRISPAVLKAMETNNYPALPAHAFARGFYALYAKALGLNDERIVNWYGEERRLYLGATQENSGSAVIYAGPETHRMASPGRARPLVTLLVLLIILGLIVAVLCWRFQVNPVTAIRDKMHLVQVRSQNRPQRFHVSDAGKVIRRSDEKKKPPLVTLKEH
jgi:cytoskeletal protein RodZ